MPEEKGKNPLPSGRGAFNDENMFSALVMKFQCGRCPAVVEMPVTADDIQKHGMPKPVRALYVERLDQRMEYAFLCESCAAIVDNYLENIMRRLDKKSALREKSQEGVSDPPPEAPDELA